MSQPPVQIPSEVWTNVFGYLSVEDKFNVRASCKHFKKLVDHWSLWKGWAVVLSFKNCAYNGQFWTTLRRRKVTSVVMRSTKAKDWKQLALSLPALTTVVVEQSSPGTLGFLKDFPHLKRLAVRGGALLFNTNSVSRPEQLTHLSICGGTFCTRTQNLLMTALGPFGNLTSLVCHDFGVSGVPFWMMQTFLSCLPELKHLSLSMKHTLRDSGSVLPVCGTPLGLSSLELISYSYNSLTEDAMRLFPCLDSLAVFYKHSHEEMQDRGLPPALHLKTWLSDLPQLSSLVVVKGPPVKMYVTSIPATVTSLTLCVAGLSSKDMAALAVQTPNLLHLHIDPWPSHLGADTAKISQLFPMLRSLKLRLEHVPEKDALHLHQLQNLEHLEVLDSQQRLPDLAARLRALTKHRLRVVASPRQRDPLSCSCVYQVY